MFDIGSGELLVLAIAALIVVGPKDLPVLLRTIGRYVGLIKRQASEFREHFDEAMRETELQQMQEDVDRMARETEAAVRAADNTRAAPGSVDTGNDHTTTGTKAAGANAGDKAEAGRDDALTTAATAKVGP